MQSISQDLLSQAARRALDRADELATHTEEPGKITRQYGTEPLISARERVRSWMEVVGLRTRVDAVGNLIGRTSDHVEIPTVVLGSHIDSVRNAGRYDGVLGVLVALAALELLGGEQPAGVAVELAAFIDEEGLAFRSSYLGSRAYAGVFDHGELRLTNSAGSTLADAVRVMAGDAGSIGPASAAGDLRGYLEIHIEQGPVLEAKGLPVGVVTAIAGQSRGTVTFMGVAGHAGTVPMSLRRDALCAAAEFVLELEREGHTVPQLVATVGQLWVDPGAGNVIPGEVRVSYDVRHQDDAVRRDACSRLQRAADEIAERRGLAAAWEALQEHPSVPCSARMRDVLRRAVLATGIECLELPSGAGHDAVSMAHLTDIGMLFVRCRGGISHHPDEAVDEADVAIAIGVLHHALRELMADIRWSSD